MPDHFWETLYLFEHDRQNITRKTSELCEDMRSLQSQTQRVIIDSRELMVKADEMLSRNIWRH